MATHKLYDYSAELEQDAREDLPKALNAAVSNLTDFVLNEIADAQRCADRLPNMGETLAELQTIKTALLVARNLSVMLAAKMAADATPQGKGCVDEESARVEWVRLGVMDA